MTIDSRTIRLLATLRLNYPSLRSMARAYNLPHGVLADILADPPRHDHVSWRQENRIRERFGLEPIRRNIELLPDERIVISQPIEKRDKRRCYHVSPELKARLDWQRHVVGLDQEQFMRWLSELADLADERLTP